MRDVCKSCNNGALGELDAYGKELYERYFVAPLYKGEKVEFHYDGERLIRWLLKLSYNSARVQNADIRILQEYRKAILGQATMPAHVRCWLHLVAPSYLNPLEAPRPAKREEEGLGSVYEPGWFRISQFRMLMNPAANLVQRTIIINSFAFTLFVAPFHSSLPNGGLDHHVTAFENDYLCNKLLRPELGTVVATAETDHVAASVYWTLFNYPSRYGTDQNSYTARLLKGEFGIVFVFIPRELIEEGTASPIAEMLNELVATRENVTAYRQRVGVSVEGYDEDSRELWQIPEARLFFRRLFSECPFMMLLDYPLGGLLRLCFACWLHEDPPLERAAEKQRIAEFLNLAFEGLNELAHRLALSEEFCRDVFVAAKQSLLDG